MIVLNSIRQMWNSYASKSLSEDGIVKNIKEVIKQNLLNNCPTKNTKLEVLGNPYYFIAHLGLEKSLKNNEKVKSFTYLIEKAFKQLEEEVKQTPGTTRDERIDQKIKQVEENLKGSTEDKIKSLKTAILEAHIYLLFKLEKRLIEEQTPEQKRQEKELASRSMWAS